jgi:hypothetical protein
MHMIHPSGQDQAACGGVGRGRIARISVARANLPHIYALVIRRQDDIALTPTPTPTCTTAELEFVYLGVYAYAFQEVELGVVGLVLEVGNPLLHLCVRVCVCMYVSMY